MRTYKVFLGRIVTTLGVIHISLAAQILHITEYKEFAELHNTNVSFFKTTPFYDGPGPVILNPGRIFSVSSVVFQDSRFSVLPANIFKVFPNVDKLSVQYCGVRFLKQSYFAEAFNLKELDLQYNDIKAISDLTFVFLANLEELSLQGNDIPFLSRDVFRGLVNLKRLYLGGNELRKLNSHLLYPLQNLEILDLSDNPIEWLFDDIFKYNAKLQEITLNNCGIKDVEDNVFSSLKELKRLEIKFNNFSTLRVPSMDRLEADFGRIRECFIDGRIPDISIGHNRLYTLLFKDLSATRNLIVTNNSLPNFEFLQGGENLISLDLSSNPIDPPDLPSDLFSEMTSLQHLNLGNLSLSSFDLYLFQNLSNLIVLNLSQNKFKNLDVKLFAPLKNLQVLDVSSRELENFDYKGLELIGFRGQLFTWND